MSRHSLRQTGRWVRLWDRAAEAVITVGGLGVFAAMLGICVYLVATAGPLFVGGSSEPEGDGAHIAGDALIEPTLLLPGDGRWGLLLGADGAFSVFDPASGAAVRSGDLSRGDGGAGVTALSYEPGADRVYVGYGDGRVRTGRVVAVDVPVRGESLSERLRAVEPGAWALVEGGEFASVRRVVRELRGVDEGVWVERGADGYRVRSVRVEMDQPIKVGEGEGAVREIAGAAVTERSRSIAVLRADGTLGVGRVRAVRGLGGGAARLRVSASEVEADFGDDPPRRLFLTADGSSVVCVWPDGRAQRYAQLDGSRSAYTLVESARLVEDGRRVTALAPALGAWSVLVGDDRGGLSVWMVTPVEGGRAGDGNAMVLGSRESLGGAAVTTISPGRRDRTIAAGLGDGSVVVLNVTSGKPVVRFGASEQGGAAGAVAISGAVDRAVRLDAGGGLNAWAIEPGHPGVSWRSLFGRVHYEGYGRAEFVYQSTGAAGAEPKYSLVPLIWGTLKATVVAMVFAVPLGILGAVFTSEFLHARVRGVVKPTMEMMATLPSVVLGYMAASLLVPYARDWLMSILVSFAVVPAVVMLGAAVWRVVPERLTRRVTSWQLMGLIAFVVAVGIVVAGRLGGVVESVLFMPDGEVLAGNPGMPVGFRAWLDGNFGGALPGWLLVCVPLAGLVVWIVMSRVLGQAWHASMDERPRTVAAAMEIVRLVVGFVTTLVLAGGFGLGLTRLGFDPRDSVFGTFSQRNTLVVGIVMGVAVIPIIYTISEDAMRSVPAHLRSASLGTGATPWQTAVRIVLPVAASGVFSACMIGLGRAVGETMIVLMATGNTPEMSMNIFAGFRTLAANIAVELPEAPRGGTHYRVLFLCGLTLFLMTLVLNTTAELVRQHFRKRNAAL